MDFVVVNDLCVQLYLPHYLVKRELTNKGNYDYDMNVM